MRFVSLFLLAACAPVVPQPPASDDGWGPESHATTARQPAPRPGTIPAEKRTRWDLADALPTFRKLDGRDPSEHFAGNFERTLAINEAAAGYALPHPRMGPGAVIVQHHHAPEREAVVATLAMRKREAGYSPKFDDWEYIVLDEQLRVAAIGTLDVCARCHVEAPHAGVFGPPTTQ